MTEERMEEESREIGQAAERYAFHHWAEWTSAPIIIAFVLWLPASFLIADFVVAYTALPEGSSQARWWMLAIWMALALSSYALLLGWFLPRYQRWVRAKIGVKTAEPAFLALFLLTLGFGVLIPRLYGLLIVPRIASPLYPLAWAWLFDVLIGGYMLGAWIRLRRNPLWRYSPPAVIVLGLFNLYAIAAALGLPQPSASAPRCMGMSYRAIVPWAGALVAFAVIGWFYSRRQFRRLQRLVNEESDGTD
jgi:hypothetical protein